MLKETARLAYGIAVAASIALQAGVAHADSPYRDVLKSDWAGTSGKKFEIHSITRHDKSGRVRVVVVEFVRRGLERQKTRWEAKTDIELEADSEAVLANDGLWAGVKDKALKAAPSVDTFDGVRHTKFRVVPDGSYEAVVKAKPFEAFLMPRFWTGSLLQKHRPVWKAFDGAEVKSLKAKSGPVIALWDNDMTLFAFAPGAKRHSAYVWTREDVSEALAAGKTIAELAGEPSCMLYSRILERDPTSGLPSRVISRNETVGLTEWFRLVGVSEAANFKVEEVPPVLKDKKVLIADSVTRRVVVVEGGDQRDVTPKASDTPDPTTTDDDAGFTTFQIVTATLGLLLVLFGLFLRRRRARA